MENLSPIAGTLTPFTQLPRLSRVSAVIEVKNLVKRFPGVEAVRDISFTVNAGEVVGLLGANGAGKSTTMRILSCFWPMTSGQVRVADYDVLTESLQVRRLIGYMPENVPLYMDMRVADYLEFRARLKGVRGRRVRERVAESMQRCGVTEVSHKMIANLSRGFRQRVALAEALVHDPKLLILDEPTAGLDPNQIRSVRELIKELGRDHTILLSTHILPEVEMVCDRAIILHQGKIQASDTLSGLVDRVDHNEVILEIQAPPDEAHRAIEAVQEVSEVELSPLAEGWVRARCVAVPGQDMRDPLWNLVRARGWNLREMRRNRVTLEEVFVELTQD